VENSSSRRSYDKKVGEREKKRKIDLNVPTMSKINFVTENNWQPGEISHGKKKKYITD